MTKEEQSIADDRMRAEIAKLVAETSEINRNFKYRFWVMMAVCAGAIGLLLKFAG